MGKHTHTLKITDECTEKTTVHPVSQLTRLLLFSVILSHSLLSHIMLTVKPVTTHLFLPFQFRLSIVYPSCASLYQQSKSPVQNKTTLETRGTGSRALSVSCFLSISRALLADTGHSLFSGQLFSWVQSLMHFFFKKAL